MDKRYLIAALFLGAAIVVGSALMWPTYQKVRTVAQLVNDRQQEFEAQTLLVNEIERLRTEYQQMDKELAQAFEFVPAMDAQSVPELFVELEGLAAQSGLFIETISFSQIGKDAKAAAGTGKPAQKRDHGVVNAKLEMKGAYQNIKRFSRAIETSKHLMDIVSLSLTAPQQEGGGGDEAAKPEAVSVATETFFITASIDAYYQ